MHKRTKSLMITPQVRQTVEERDGGLCIFCHRPGRGEAHVVSRAHGGLGIEENIVTVCRPCHDMMDNSEHRPMMLSIAAANLREIYPDWNRASLVYHK